MIGHQLANRIDEEAVDSLILLFIEKPLELLDEFDKALSLCLNCIIYIRTSSFWLVSMVLGRLSSVSPLIALIDERFWRV